jgi:hypothetical protein
MQNNRIKMDDGKRFNITDCVKRQKYRIQYRDEEGKRITKDFRYIKSKEAAMAKAIEYRNTLLALEINI